MNKISIITVCFNSQKTIEKTLESISMQTYKNFEHIIMDGGSTDKTLELIKNYQGHPLKLFSESDFGAYDAMNKGLKKATGDIVAFLHSDDLYANKDVLATIAQLFEQKDCDLIYADLIYVRQGDLSKPIRTWRSRPYQAGLFERGWMPAHPTVFIRRKIYEQYGGFSTDFKIASDFDLMCRFLAKHQVSSYYLPQCLVKMQLGGMSNRSLKNILLSNIEARRACINNSLTPVRFFIAKKVLSKVPQLFG